jgi:hypothetical protein
VPPGTGEGEEREERGTWEGSEGETGGEGREEEGIWEGGWGGAESGREGRDQIKKKEI